MARFDGPLAPYPDDTGVKARLLDGPVSPPAPPDPAPKAQRRSGGDCDVLATLGLARTQQPAAREDAMRWSEDVRTATTENLMRAGVTWR
jgi:hypothetical protein